MDEPFIPPNDSPDIRRTSEPSPLVGVLLRVGLDAASVAIYALSLIAAYVFFISPFFAYMGYELYASDARSIALAVLLSVLPIVFYRGVTGVSSVVVVFIYGLIYVPSLVVVSLGTDLTDGRALQVQAIFMASMSLLLLAAGTNIRLPFRLSLPFSVPLVALLVTIGSIVYVTLVYEGNLALVSFADVYTHRFANQSIGTDVATRYLTAWMTNVFAPICLAYGLVTRSPLYISVGGAGFLIMYLATAAKFAVVMPLAFMAIYWLMSESRRKGLVRHLMLSLSILSLALMLTSERETVLFTIASLLLMRTFINGGIVTAKYHDFFEAHPQTGLTHVNLIGDLFGHYPYGDLTVGQVVGRYYWSLDMNANGHFWATDGLAAFGLLGVPIATAICASVLIAMDAATDRWDLRFVVLCFLPFTLQLLNTSVFQSVWSGGALFLIVIFVTARRPNVLQDSCEEAVGRRGDQSRVWRPPSVSATT